MDKRVTLFAGHYGSGKTNIAVNFALKLKNGYDNVAIADLDIVNPYFRTKDSAAVLSENGIRLISSEYANTNVDVPALPAEAYAVVEDRRIRAVIEVGGDDRGALALGRYTPFLTEENDFDMFFVVNFCRPLTRTPSDAAAVMSEIETAAGIRFTGIVNNTNLGSETTAATVEKSADTAAELERLTGHKTVMTAVEKSISPAPGTYLGELFKIQIYVKQQ